GDARHFEHVHTSVGIELDPDWILDERIAGDELHVIPGRKIERLQLVFRRARGRNLRNFLHGHRPGGTPLSGDAEAGGKSGCDNDCRDNRGPHTDHGHPRRVTAPALVWTAISVTSGRRASGSAMRPGRAGTAPCPAPPARDCGAPFASTRGPDPRLACPAGVRWRPRSRDGTRARSAPSGSAPTTRRRRARTTPRPRTSARPPIRSCARG